MCPWLGRSWLEASAVGQASAGIVLQPRMCDKFHNHRARNTARMRAINDGALEILH